MDHRPYTNRPQYTRTRCRRQLPWHQLSRSCRQHKPVKCSCRCLLKKSCWRSLVNCWMMRIQNWKKPEIQYTHPDQAIRNLNLQGQRSEEHTSELQSRENLVCRLLLEKKKRNLYF